MATHLAPRLCGTVWPDRGRRLPARRHFADRDHREGYTPSMATNACTAAARRCAMARGWRRASPRKQGALDLLLCNVVVIDAVLGIVKGDIGVKDGRIVGIGKAGNPAIMDGVDPRLVVVAGHDRARLRGADRHRRRHRRACAFRFRGALRSRHRLRHYDDDRRLARADHGRHRFRRPVQRRQDAAGRRALANQFRLPRARQLA